MKANSHFPFRSLYYQPDEINSATLLTGPVWGAIPLKVFYNKTFN